MKKYNFIFFIAIIALLSGCKGCDKNNFGNGNANPSKLNIEIQGTTIKQIIKDEFGNCSLPSMDVEIDLSVRTASIINGQVVVDEDAYYESASDVNIDGNFVTQIEVPEEGGYGLFIKITFADCSLCCNLSTHTLKNACGNGQEYDTEEGIWYCQGGQPRLNFEKIFSIETRPPHVLNYFPRFHVIKCKNCNDCWIPCYE